MSNPEHDVLDAIAALEAEVDEIKQLVDWQIEQGLDSGEYDDGHRTALQRAHDWATSQSVRSHMFFDQNCIVSKVYPEGMESLLCGTVDWMADDIRAMLCTSEFWIDGSHRFLIDVAHCELAGEGYEPGGKALTGKCVAPNGDLAMFNADNVIWRIARFHAYGAVVYHCTGDPATSRLIMGIQIRPFGAFADGNAFALNWLSGCAISLAMSGVT